MADWLTDLRTELLFRSTSMVSLQILEMAALGGINDKISQISEKIRFFS